MIKFFIYGTKSAINSNEFIIPICIKLNDNNFSFLELIDEDYEI